MRWYFSSFLFVSVLALVVAVFEPDFDPSPELLRTMAGIGISLFLAYVIEATWLAQNFDPGDDKKSEVLLEAVTGIAICGLMAIALTLALSEHPSNEPFSWADIYYFWWSSAAYVTLGILVAVHPALAHEFGRGSKSSPSKDEDSESVKD